MNAPGPFVEIVQAGNRLDSLRALRDVLAIEIELSKQPRDTAALSLRLMDVLEQITDLEKALPTENRTALDEFTKRRVERQQAPRKGRTASGRK